MHRDVFQTQESKAIIHEYNHRRALTPQDVVKCYLRLYSSNISPAYDCRVHLWNTRPGDVIYIDGVFRPLLSCFAIDDGDRHWKCIHIKERESQGNRRPFLRSGIAKQSLGTRPCDRNCRKWYAYYKKESGKVGMFHPDYDGVTTICREDIERVLKVLRHRDRRALRSFFAVDNSPTERAELMKCLRSKFVIDKPNAGSSLKSRVPTLLGTGEKSKQSQ